MACEYSFSPKELLDDSRGNDIVRNMMVSDMSTKECSRKEVEGYDYCVFHLPIEKRRKEGIPSEATQNKIVEEIKKSPRGDFTLYGGIVEELQITPQRLPNGTVGKITLTGVRILGKVKFRSITINGVRAVGSIFKEQIELERLNVVGDCSFRYSEFDSLFKSLKCEFSESADFMQAEFNSNFRCNSTFEESANFKGAEFEGEVKFRGVTVHGNFGLSNVRMKGRVDFVWATCKGGFRLLPRNNGERLMVNLSVANISGGRVAVGNETYYNLHHCTLGDVDFVTKNGWHHTLDDNEEDEIIDRELFQHLLMRNTEFDGFEFQKYRHLLEAVDWCIHKTKLDVSEFERPLYYMYQTEEGFVEIKGLDPMRVNELESTYLKAKRGAIQVSEQKSASEFFVKEMRNRRLRHIREMKDVSTISGKANQFKKWLSNLFFEIIAGYGERPVRVILSFMMLSFVIIPNLEPYFGPMHTLYDVTRAFFVAVLVFTLTRSVER